MSTQKNKVTLIGRVGAAPEFKVFDSGKKLATFSLATNESYKDKNGEWQDNVQWHTIKAWGKVAEDINQTLEKGKEVLLEGKIVYQVYETKTGEKGCQTVIEIHEFMILSAKPPQAAGE